MKTLHKKSSFFAFLFLFFFATVAVLATYFVTGDRSFDDRGEAQTVMLKKTFVESTEYIKNPYMGLLGDTIVFADGPWTWADIEEVKGQYQFGPKGNPNLPVMVAVVADYPRATRDMSLNNLDIPRWLYEELKADAGVTNDQQILDEFNRTQASTADIPGVGTFYRMVEAGYPSVGFSPNYKNPRMISYHDKLMQAFANHYDNDGTYIVIMGSLGHWGEMHTYYIQDQNASGRYPQKEIASQYESTYAKYFKIAPVSSRNPRVVARDNDFGLHNHAFGDPRHTYDWFVDFFQNGYTCYYTGDHHPAMPDFWETAPSGAEFLSTGDNRFLTNSNIDATIQQARDTYLTWLIPPWPQLTSETSHNLNRLLGKIGYRFSIIEANYDSSVNIGQNIQLVTKWRNGGTAPFYHDWPIIVQLQNSNGQIVADSVINSSVRSLFPDVTETYTTSISTPSNLPTGKYDLYVGILNPKTGQPSINLAVVGVPNENKLYNIGSIDLTSSSTPPSVSPRYSRSSNICNSDGKYDCIEDSSGDFSSLSACESSCIPAPVSPRYSRSSNICNSDGKYDCIEDSSGDFSSLSACESSCIPAPTSPPQAEECIDDSDCRRQPPYEICFENVCLLGDIRNDGNINLGDFSEFKKDFITFKKSGWNDDLKRSDFNNDERISMADYSIFIKNYRLIRQLN